MDLSNRYNRAAWWALIFMTFVERSGSNSMDIIRLGGVVPFFGS